MLAKPKRYSTSLHAISHGRGLKWILVHSSWSLPRYKHPWHTYLGCFQPHEEHEAPHAIVGSTELGTVYVTASN